MQQQIGASTAYLQDRALMSPVRPDRELAAAQRYFGCSGVSGPTAIMAGMVEIDRKRHTAVAA